MTNSTSVTVVVAMGQGVVVPRSDGLQHLSEYPDDGAVHLDHMRAVPERVRVIRAETRGPIVLVASGGRTNDGAPTLSEAESFVTVFEQSGSWPPVPVVLEDLSLDSAENVCFSLMAARLYLDGLLFDRTEAPRLSRVRTKPANEGASICSLILLACWEVKALRVLATAASLRIPEVRVDGFAAPDRTAKPADAILGETRVVAHLNRDCNALLRCAGCEAKRRLRFSRTSDPTDFDKRLHLLEQFFPATMSSMARLQDEPSSTAALDALRGAFQAEVLK